MVSFIIHTIHYYIIDTKPKILMNIGRCSKLSCQNFDSATGSRIICIESNESCESDRAILNGVLFRKKQ